MSKPDALARWHDFLDEVEILLEHGASKAALSQHRVERTRKDPALFALVYLSRHLTDPATGRVTLSPVHEAWAKRARGWMKPQTKPAADRRAEIAPREMGKSTWWFLVLPMWAAAHGFIRFAAAFADTDTQAQTHLATFKAELDGNPLIREDFPLLVEPKTRGRGTVMADRVSLYHAASGFVFAAAGMDSSNLGMKVGDRRPDLIILDDIEPHEARYSKELATKRLNTLRQAILPLNVRAHVVVVGTVTMSGSIVHQIVKRARGEFDDGPDDPTAWVAEENIGARHWMPFATDARGDRVSVWPAKWPLAYLESIEHTRGFALNYLNDPLGADGDYWTMDDFVPLTPELDAAITHEVIEIDPAVTTNVSSDFTAIAAVGWSRALGKCAVYEARQFKIGPDEIRLQVLRFVERALERGHVVIVRIEANQGGDLWKRILHDMPVKVVTHPAGTASKNVRAADALDHYNRGRVEHVREKLREAEGQMVAFPKAPHDDLVDAVGAGVRYFLSRGKKRSVQVGATSIPYA